jgi:transposase
MSKQRIERVDSIPLIVYWLKKMRVQEIIDALWHPHTNWTGLSYGQLVVLFLTYVLYMRTHRLSQLEEWVMTHRTVLEQATGWEISDKDATDDRLDIVLDAVGQDEEHSVQFQRQLGQHLIQAYALPTEVARYDTTTVSVHHRPSKTDGNSEGILRFGKSKDRRPDLVQFKQGLGTLDPAGIPLVTATVPGSAADDPLYIPAWREMVQTIGHTAFLYVADCKAGALTTRGTIDYEGGHYLFPLPMTGDVPDWLSTWVFDPPFKPQPIHLEGVMDKHGEPRQVGRGFVVDRDMQVELADGHPHQWTEQWMVTQSTAHARRQRKALRARLEKADRALKRLKPKKEERAAAFQARAEQILQRYKVTDLISLTVEETITHHKRYLNPGRPTPDSPYQVVEQRQLQLHPHHDVTAIKRQLRLAGWRIYVSNVHLSLNQAVTYYRGEWLVEHGFHRFKKGSLPVSPLWIRIPKRIRGLMFLLMVALQALTLLEFVARRELSQRQETIAGLVPGNPKMKTDRPTAERMLAQFSNLHLLVEETDAHITAHLVESLTLLQRRILTLLHIPEAVYDFTFSCRMPEPKFHNST